MFPVIVVMFILYFIRVFTLVGGSMNDLLDNFNDTALNGLIPGGIPGLSGFSGQSFDTPPGGSAGLYNAPQAQSYNAPQQVGYNAPSSAYNANLLLSGQRFDLSLPSNNHVPQMQFMNSNPNTFNQQEDLTLSPEELELYHQFLLSKPSLYL